MLEVGGPTLHCRELEVPRWPCKRQEASCQPFWGACLPTLGHEEASYAMLWCKEAWLVERSSFDDVHPMLSWMDNWSEEWSLGRLTHFFVHVGGVRLLLSQGIV